MGKKYWLYLLLAFTLITMYQAEVSAQVVTQEQPSVLADSLLTTGKALQLQNKDRALSLRIISEMRQRKMDSEYALDKAEAAILYNGMEFGKALDIYQRMLDNPDVKADKEKKMDVLESLCDTHDVLQHAKEKLDCINQLLDIAQRANNKYYHSIALFLLGKTIFYEGSHDKGISNVEQAIRIMEQADNKNRIHLLHSQMNVLATLFIEEKKFDEALKTMDRNEQVLRSEQPVDIDDLMVLLAKKANLLVKMKRTEKADSVYAEWKKLPKNADNPRTYFIIDFLRNRGLYEDAMPVYYKRLDQMRQTGDTMNIMTYIMKWGMAETAYALHHYQQSADLYLDVVNIGETLRSQAAVSKAQEIEAIYQTHEKEKQISRQRSLLLILTAAVALLVIGAVVWGRVTTRMRRKNRTMAQTINELMEYRELVRQYTAPKSEEDKDGQEPPATDAERDAFLEFDAKVVSQHLFCNPDFDREQLIRVSGIEKNRLSAIIRRSAGTNIPGYINSKRVEHAVQLMKEHPDYTLAAIAEDSGFTSQTTFIRAFRSIYDMTPSDYRQASLLPPPRWQKIKTVNSLVADVLRNGRTKWKGSGQIEKAVGQNENTTDVLKTTLSLLLPTFAVQNHSAKKWRTQSDYIS